MDSKKKSTFKNGIGRTDTFIEQRMNILVVLIAVSLMLAFGFLAAFLWAMNRGQYEDTHTPAMRMLLDENQNHITSNPSSSTEN